MFIIVLIIFILVGYIILFLLQDGPSPQDYPPNDAPSSAYYLGGTDGGVWVDTIRVNKTRVDYIIYLESGKLVDTCKLIADDKVSLNKKISRVIGYNGKNLIIDK